MRRLKCWLRYQTRRATRLYWSLRIKAEPRPAAKTISAMVRVKNEGEFVEASVRSIVDLVDEVVIVDNLSTDQTPQIIAKLASEYPEKIRTYSYEYRLARQGEENAALASSGDWRSSPHSIANFYEYCISLCNHPYILKWDADTIATQAMAPALERFRSNSAEVLWHIGANVHENRRVLIAGHPYEDPEPRLFRRKFARYDNELVYYETLQSPFLRDDLGKFSERCPEILYVHMKYCKKDRFSNVSEDLRRREIKNNMPGAVASPDILNTLSRWAPTLWLVAIC